jgi:hypothetical protein
MIKNDWIIIPYFKYNLWFSPNTILHQNLLQGDEGDWGFFVYN